MRKGGQGRMSEQDDQTSDTEAEAEEDAREDEGYSLAEDLVPAVRLAVAAGDKERLAELFEPLHPADIADLLEQVDKGLRREILLLASEQIDGDVLSEIDESIRDEVVEFLPNDIVAEAVRDLESDDVVDLLEDLEDEQAEVVLNALEESERAAVEAAMAYPEESAGRLMQREVVAAPEHWNVGQTIDYMRSHDDLPDQFYHVVLVDPRHRPTGYVTLGMRMASPRATALADITEDSFLMIPVAQDEGEVAYAFNQYHLISAPVVDENERLVGIITIDDAMAILDEEHEEDILRLVGVGEESLASSPMEIMRRSFPWLFVNLITAILASLVISVFEDIIAVLVALAVLMPIVASMGGNAGTQSLTVAVRAIARDAGRPDDVRAAMRDDDALVRIHAAGGILAAAN